MGEPHEFSVNAYLSAKNVGLFGIAIAALYYVGASYRLYQRETSLVGRQAFTAGPNDELVGRRGPVTHNGRGPLRITRSQNRGQKMHGSMHVSGTCNW